MKRRGFFFAGHSATRRLLDIADSRLHYTQLDQELVWFGSKFYRIAFSLVVSFLPFNPVYAPNPRSAHCSLWSRLIDNRLKTYPWNRALTQDFLFTSLSVLHENRISVYVGLFKIAVRLLWLFDFLNYKSTTITGYCWMVTVIKPRRSQRMVVQRALVRLIDNHNALSVWRKYDGAVLWIKHSTSYPSCCGQFLLLWGCRPRYQRTSSLFIFIVQEGKGGLLTRD